MEVGGSGSSSAKAASCRFVDNKQAGVLVYDDSSGKLTECEALRNGHKDAYIIGISRR